MRASGFSICLTFGTVVSFSIVGVLLEAIETNLVAMIVTNVMTELVISWSAQSVTIFAIVMGRANHTIFILETGMTLTSLVNSMSPILTSFELLLGSHSANKSIAL